LWRTLVADRDPNGEPPPGWYHRASLHCLVSRTVNHRINTQNIPDKYVKEEGIVRDFLKRVQAVTWNRRFLETSDGLVGIAPGQTEKGDKVCILSVAQFQSSFAKGAGSMSSLAKLIYMARWMVKQLLLMKIRGGRSQILLLFVESHRYLQRWRMWMITGEVIQE
jgi:hypothetical protein